MSTDTFRILLEQVTGASIGIKSTIDDMKTIAVDKIDGPSGQYGHDDLASAFQSFCDRWDQGVKDLISDTEGLADALDLAVANYARQDQVSAKALGIPIVE
ncbi:WXG100 family type VII secretion target [Gordonia sp. DT218]|uniref:WXG100 family type VII secretion target n=1 Tax=Gordonia sp. DT218 TaxID=3416659 RepID=UPI003CEB04A4